MKKYKLQKKVIGNEWKEFSKAPLNKSIIKLAKSGVLVVMTASLLLSGCSTETKDDYQSSSIVTKGDYQSSAVVISYEVSSGDTLIELAEEYGTTVEEIIKLNKIDNPNNIEVGQVLIIPYNKEIKTITVETGDTLTKLARKHNTTVEEIVELNGIEDIDKIEVGQKLVIPVVEPKKLDLDKWDKQLEEKGYVQGIDVSSEQKGIDLDYVLKKNEEIEFVVLRSFYFWIDEPYDESFDDYSQIADNNGKAVGTYFWPTLRNVKTTKKELDTLIAKLKELEEKGIYYTMPIFMDIETKDCGGFDLADRIKAGDPDTIKSFKFAIDYLKENGYEVMVYTGASCAREYGVYELAKKYDVDLWLSGGSYFKSRVPISADPDKYADELTNLEGANVGRQYSEGLVKGYNDKVDINIWYENTPRKIIENGYNNTDEMPKSKLR